MPDSHLSKVSSSQTSVRAAETSVQADSPERRDTAAAYGESGERAPGGAVREAKDSPAPTSPAPTSQPNGAGEAHSDLSQSGFSVSEAIKAPRLVISEVSPTVDGGQRPAKATEKQTVVVNATVFADGHNRLAARVLWKHASDDHWSSKRMQLLGNDLWRAEFKPQKQGNYYFCIEGWLDRWQNFHHELYEKYHAGVPISLEVKEGMLLLQEFKDYWQREGGANLADDEDIKVVSCDEIPAAAAHNRLAEAIDHLTAAAAENDLTRQVQLLLDQELAEAVEVLEPKKFLTRSSQAYLLHVERTKAGFASWYELFPRSITDATDGHGTFDDVIGRLPVIREMGFDVLYFPPIHPIGERNRKGKNNSVTAQPGEPGSPYAIGSAEGGHDAVYQRLGGIEAFRRMRDAARENGLELAMDFAIQCSPDHPWLKEHPDWFNWRPDGSIRYAENPPKKYQDIVNVEFYAPGALPDMWVQWRDIVLYWISEGVTIFRVDNPHTKPLPFWEWLIADVRARHPEAMFLSEAFTRPAMMYQLAKIGFSQSYTYFIWRNSKQELTDYLTELSSTPVNAFYRPNFFVNTPDINPYFLQTSGRPGFLIRAALAATMSGLWGVYSGFELCEAAPLPGKEEYLDSEKYEIRPRDFNTPGNIVAEITRLNAIRKANPALQTHQGIRFHASGNDKVLFFSKAADNNRNFILVGISLDPHQGQDATLSLPTEALGVSEHAEFQVTELMRNIDFTWYGKHQHWYFNPGELPFSIWRLTPKAPG